jgi:hypothetical protein
MTGLVCTQYIDLLAEPLCQFVKGLGNPMTGLEHMRLP